MSFLLGDHVLEVGVFVEGVQGRKAVENPFDAFATPSLGKFLPRQDTVIVNVHDFENGVDVVLDDRHFFCADFGLPFGDERRAD